MAGNVARRLVENRWRVRSVDPAVLLELEPQLPPNDGWQADSAPSIGVLQCTGSEPSVQWNAEGPKSINLSGAFISRDMTHDVRPLEARLWALVARDPVLGRAPRVQVTWRHLEITGFVANLRVKVPGFWVSGLPRSVAFEFEVTRAKPLSFELEDTNAGETQFVTLRDGDTFEELGRRYYGAALKGELIRRENPELAAGEAGGDVAKVLEADHPRVRGVEVRPSSIPFAERTPGRGTWRILLQELGETRGSSSDPGTPWGRLPEVVAGEV